MQFRDYMKKRYTATVPRKPLLRRATYLIPDSYVEAYRKAGIKDKDQQMMLFHVTQFGGFRIRRMPKDLHINSGFVEKWLKYDNDSGFHSYKANAAFLLRFGDLELRPLLRIWRNDAVNGNEMADHGFTSDEIRDAGSFLAKLNKFYSQFRLDISMPHSGITADDRVKLSRFHAIPYLVKKPKAGGRYFHPESSYQRVPSALRRLMTINGERSSEIDLTAAVIQFIGVALRKHKLPTIDDTVLSYDDPYQYFLSYLNSFRAFNEYGEQSFEREALKTILYTAIYSSPEKEARHVNSKFRRMRRSYKHKDFVQLFPEFFNALSGLRAATSMPLHMVVYREESRYAQEVLQRGCLEQRLPILPLHDSFLTTTAHAEDLMRVMDEASKRMFGMQLRYRQKY